MAEPVRALVLLITFPIWIIPAIVYYSWDYWDDLREEDIFTREP